VGTVVPSSFDSTAVKPTAVATLDIPVVTNLTRTDNTVTAALTQIAGRRTVVVGRDGRAGGIASVTVQCVAIVTLLIRFNDAIAAAPADLSGNRTDPATHVHVTCGATVVIDGIAVVTLLR
jgi:hypothetical protein